MGKDFEFSWLGKDQAVQNAKTPTDCQILWENIDKKENILIKGDNLDALKNLIPLYREKVDFIYVDPPYNTRYRMTYSDRLSRSEWLSMLYPRLVLAKDLLSKEGAAIENSS